MVKPTVVVLTTSYHPFMGGAEIAIQEILKRLQDRFDFFILTSRLSRSLPRCEIRPEGRIFRIGIGSRIDKWLLPIFIPWMMLRFNRAHKLKSKPLILWGVDISQGSLAGAVTKLFFPHIPFVFTLQYGYGEDRIKSGRLGFIGIAFKYMLWQADYLTAISSYLLNLAKQYKYQGKADIIYNGVDIKKFEDGRDITSIKEENKKIIITTSRLVPKNGVDIIIRSIAEVKKSLPDVQLYVVGEGFERPRLERLTKDLGIENEVKFFGNVPYEKIPQYLHKADIFVRSSRSEGMGNSFVEALAAGLPIIGTRVGGITDIIYDGKTGIFVKIDDPKDLAEKIIQLFRNKKLARSLASEGKKMVEDKFSWDKIAASFKNIFNKKSRGRILNVTIATPLFPPNLGGPALYAKNLSEGFRNKGHRVRVVDFGPFLRYPGGLRHFFYFLKLFLESLGSDVILSLDHFSVGAPALLASVLLNCRMVLRLEGDFLWENFVEKNRKKITLRGFYEHPPVLSFKENFTKRITNLVIRQSSLVAVSSEWRREMISEFFGIPVEKMIIVKNVIPKLNIKVESGSRKKVVLWAGRMLYLKNLYSLILAFKKVNNAGEYELHLVGNGAELENLKKFAEKEEVNKVFFFPPVSHEKLIEKISQASFFVLPSFSDVGPNVIADALSTETPFIITKESGYAEYASFGGYAVDPLDEGDLVSKLKMLMNDSNRRERAARIRDFVFWNNWEDAVEKWLGLFYSIFHRIPAVVKKKISKILVVGKDPDLFVENSQAFKRVNEYAELFDEYHIVNMAARKPAYQSRGVKFFLWPANSSVPPLRWFKAARLGRKLVKKHKLELVDAQDADESGLAAYLISRLTKIPLRLQIHTDVASPYFRNASWKEMFRFRIAKFLIPRADCIRVVSERVKAGILKIINCKLQIVSTTVLPIFTDIDRFFSANVSPEFKDLFRDYDFKMIAVGRLIDKEKNFGMLIEVMRGFVNICPKALLVLVGEGRDKPYYRGLIEHSGLQKNVIIQTMGTDKLPGFYKLFDLFLLSSNYEGWGRTVVEALAAGLPVVMTDVGVAGEVIKDGVNGMVVPVGDKDAFLAAITDVFKNTEKRKQFRIASEETAKKIKLKTKEEYLREYFQCLEDCV